MSHSYSFKNLLTNEEKKDNSLQKEYSNSNINNKANNSLANNSNINHYSIKKVILKYHSPKDNKKNNISNNSSSIPNIVIKDKPNKNSRAYINNYNSKNNDLSENKSKTFLNENQQPLIEIKEIKEIKEIN